MKDFSRADRLASLITRELSEILRDYPELPADLIISVTEVELSRDLRQGKIYYSVLGDSDAIDKAEQFFNAHHKGIRKKLAGEIRIRYMPELKFQYDASIQRGQRISELLEQINKDDTEKQ